MANTANDNQTEAELNDTLRANLMKLPERCFAIHPSTGGWVLLIRGETGFRTFETRTGIPPINPVDWNVLNGITTQQVQAMLAGSLFGYDTPAANPDKYDVDGRFNADG